MGKLKDLRDRLKPLTKAQLHKDVMDVIIGEREFIFNLLREQLQGGLMPDGSQIGVYQSEAYAAMKGHDYVDLFLTGDLYYSLVLERVDDATLAIYADDVKTEELLTKYGDFLGLTVGSIKVLAAHVKPKIADRQRGYYGIN